MRGAPAGPSQEEFKEWTFLTAAALRGKSAVARHEPTTPRPRGSCRDHLCLALSRVIYATPTHARIVAVLVEEFDKVHRQTLSEIPPN